MSTWWVDPYQESSNGGIHGTTGTGSGTYAAPWKISDLFDNNSSNKYSSLANGDEVRLKGQTLANYNFVATNWTSITESTSGGITYASRYNHATITDKLSYAIRRDTGEKVWKSQGDSYQQYDTTEYVSTWREGFPHLQGSSNTTGLHVMPSDWNLQKSTLMSANGGSNNLYWLNGDNSNLSQLTQYHAIKVTAGWVSETSQTDGYTILMTDSSNTDSGRFGWGCTNYSYYGMGYIWWDCLTPGKLVIATSSDSSDVRLGGGKIHIDAFKGCNYQPGYYTEIGCSGEIIINQFGGGGYDKFWMKTNPSDNSSDAKYDTSQYQHMMDCRMWTGGYQNEIQCYWPSESERSSLTNTSPREITYKPKYYDGYYGFKVYDQDGNYPGTFTVQFPDGWHHTKEQAGFTLHNFKTDIKTITETIGTVSTHAPYFPTGIGVEENAGYGGLGNNPVTNQSWWDHSGDATGMLSSATSIFGAAEVSSAYRSWASDLTLTNSETLETATGNPLSITSTASTGLPYKVTVFKNSEDQRPLTLVGPDNNNSGAPIMHFNSPANSNKLCWHFFNNNNGYTYGDVYAIQIPDFSSNALRFNGDFSFTASMSLTWSVGLYYVQADNDSPSFHTNQVFGPWTSPTETSTTAVFSEDMTSAAMVSANPKTLWVYVKITKGNNTKGNVIFNQLDLTQI